MTRRLSAPYVSEWLRFCKAQLSTIAATLAEWACVWLLSAGGVYYVLAAIGGAGLGAVLDFAIKKWWVFGTARRFAAAEGIRYAVVSGASALLFGGAVYLFVDVFRQRMPVAVVAGSMIVGVCWNYPLHRCFVFSSTTPTGAAT